MPVPGCQVGFQGVVGYGLDLRRLRNGCGHEYGGWLRQCYCLLLPAGLFVAAGHEGSGLCWGTGTAQLLSHYITGSSAPGAGPGCDVVKFKQLLPEKRLVALDRSCA